MNEKEIIISTLPEKTECPLTERGKYEIINAIKFFKKEKIKIDLIFSSDLLRTTQTAEMIARVLDIETINFDKRLRDIQAGIYDGKSAGEYHSFWKKIDDRFVKRSDGGENYNDVKIRMYEFLKEIDG
ncbi:isoleucine--tRNA ligase, partial [Candidatus Nomurabacteria bacterium CG_4_10_14_0_2_um_filter_33_9]